MSTSPPSAAEALRAIAVILESAAHGEGWAQPATLVRIDSLPREPSDHLEFALRKLEPGVHPLAVIDGLVAEPPCMGLGVVVEGESFDFAGEPAGRVRVVDLLLRDGTRVSGLRKRDGPFEVEVAQPDAPVDGEIPRALCRALGIPIVGGRLACASDRGGG